MMFKWMPIPVLCLIGCLLLSCKDEKTVVSADTGKLTNASELRSSALAGRGTTHFRTYDTSDGLTSLYIESACQDRDGNLWFGSTCFDGETFTRHLFSEGDAHYDSYITYSDREGYIWFGSLNGEGAVRYDGKTYSRFTVDEGLANNVVQSILQDRDGYIWFGTRGGVSRYDGKTFSNFKFENGLDNIIITIYQDQEGHIWAGTPAGLIQYDGRKFVDVAEPDSLGFVTSILEDKNGAMWIGTTKNGVYEYKDEVLRNFKVEDGLLSNQIHSSFIDEEGHIWFGTSEGVSIYDGEMWNTFGADEGLVDIVDAIFQDQEGFLWIVTPGEVRRYSSAFRSFSKQDGLADGAVLSILQDRNGFLWFGTDKGISRYDGKEFVNFIEDKGSLEYFSAMIQDHGGRLWFGTIKTGVYRYDGESFLNFTEKDGLVWNGIRSMLQDPEGNLWFGCFGRGAKGVIVYNGETFLNLSEKDGLVDGDVRAMSQDLDGNLWFGTSGGISKYDGKVFTNFTTENGLIDDSVWSMIVDRDGSIWFGTENGVSRYDGKAFTTLEERALRSKRVNVIYQDHKNNLLFGTAGGVIQYDGEVCQTLTRHDGLESGGVFSILEDNERNLWFGTTKGVTRLNRPEPFPPKIKIDAVVADRRYSGLQSVDIPSTVDLVAFEFHSRNLKTNEDIMVYRYRLQGHEDTWKITRERRVEYQNIPSGNYTFEVQAVDRDLVYSEQPAEVRLTLKPSYDTIILVGGLGIGLIMTVFASAYGIKSRQQVRRAEQALIREMENELQTAHDMQMSLMPTGSPEIEGIELAGRCITANHVGGDFFQYFELGGRVYVSMADVTGHAMDAAIPVVMFNGVLDKQMEMGGKLEDIFNGLNGSMVRNLDKRTFVCYVMVEIDIVTHKCRLSNGGCPYPYHYKASTKEAVELQLDAYPLGVKPDTEYDVLEVQLERGDSIIMCSDGIIEAENVEGEQLGFEKTEEVIRQACVEGLPAEAMIDRILQVVAKFSGDAKQGDDMTCVVVRVE